MHQLNLLEFLDQSTHFPLLDVRSPEEFEQGHLPQSINMPLFNNEERIIVGTLYKKEGAKIAFKKGLDFIGPKLSHFVKQAENLNAETLLVHCWRGGLRSQSIASLLAAAGFNTFTLNGGYKSYRTAGKLYFDQKLPLLVLTGFTGSKKTEILIALKQLGEQVIDLEGLANHHGSVFGRPLDDIQPTPEQFQNLIFDVFRTFDLNKRIWIEDESMKIGRVHLWENLYRQKNEAPHVLITVPDSVRINHLIAQYAVLPKDVLIAATIGVSKKLGMDETTKALSAIDKNDAVIAAKTLLTYYDNRYLKSIEKKKNVIKYNLQPTSNVPSEIAKEILENL